MVDVQGHPPDAGEDPGRGVASQEPTRSRRRKWLFRAILLLIIAGSAEIAAYAVIELSRPYLAADIRTTSDIYHQQSELIDDILESDGRAASAHPWRRDEFDGLLGWRYLPGFRHPDLPGEVVNSAGLRADHEYDPMPPDGVLRVAAFGDSFVWGVGSPLSETWPYFLEQSNSAVEVLNYGVGGYGTDQALLRYRREGTRLSPDVVLIGFAPVNLGRNVNRYRRFLSTREWIWVKPRFLLRDDGDLELLPSPISEVEQWEHYRDHPSDVRALGEHDGWYDRLIYENFLYDYSAAVRLTVNTWLRLGNRYLFPDRLVSAGVFNRSSSAFRLTVSLLEEFAANVRSDGPTPAILLLPDRRSVRLALEGGEPVYDPLVEALEGVEVWDPLDAFVDFGTGGGDIEELFVPDGHYSGEGNRRLAAWLDERLITVAEPRGRSRD